MKTTPITNWVSSATQGVFQRRMQRSKRRRQKTIDAGHEGQARHGSQIRAGGADVAERDQKRRDRKNAKDIPTRSAVFAIACTRPCRLLTSDDGSASSTQTVPMM